MEYDAHLYAQRKATDAGSYGGNYYEAEYYRRSESNTSKTILAIIVMAAAFHMFVEISNVDFDVFNIKTVKYRLESDSDQILTAIKHGALDTTPYNISQLLPPFLRYTEIFETSQRYHINVCMIPKVMSSLALGILCYLKNPAKFKAHGRNMSTEKWHWSFCEERNVVKNYSLITADYGSIYLAFIREPIDRFLSGFVNKCILKGPYEHLDYCFGCGSNLNCFVRALRKELWNIYKRNGKLDSPIGAHLSPLTWNCNFKEHLHSYILLRYENGEAGVQRMAEELYRIFESVAVPKRQRDDIRNAVLVGKSPHSTSSSNQRAEAERKLFADKTLLRTVIELYYYDFVVFGYAIPSTE